VKQYVRQYLKVIETEGVVYNSEFNALMLNRGRVFLPAIKGPGGLFVEGIRQNEALLGENGICFMSGTLEHTTTGPKFVHNVPFTFIQLRLQKLMDIPIPEEKFSVSLQEVYNDCVPYVDKIAEIVAESLGNKSLKLLAVPVHFPKGNLYFFEIYQLPATGGPVKGAYVVHNSFGITRIALRKNHKDKLPVLAFESAYSSLYVENPQTV
jgi:hypothetical protein